jgi:hypothetical protein
VTVVGVALLASIMAASHSRTFCRGTLRREATTMVPGIASPRECTVYTVLDEGNHPDAWLRSTDSLQLSELL